MAFVALRHRMVDGEVVPVAVGVLSVLTWLRRGMALAVARRLVHALVLACVFGSIAGAAGYVVAYLLALPVGASQAGVAGIFALVGIGIGALRKRC